MTECKLNNWKTPRPIVRTTVTYINVPFWVSQTDESLKFEVFLNFGEIKEINTGHTSCWSSALSWETKAVPSSSSKAFMVLRMDFRSTSKCDKPCSYRMYQKEVTEHYSNTSQFFQHNFHISFISMRVACSGWMADDIYP